MKAKIAILIFVITSQIIIGQNWKIPEGAMITKWANEVEPENVLPEYPRPNLQREEWLNLNGLWDYAITGKDEKSPDKYEGKILVPFPIESSLSGVKRSLLAKDKLWYKKTFIIPNEWDEKRILLNFGAVDWDCTVWVNDKIVGNHKGGYDSFTFDITDHLKKENEQTIILSVWDPTDEGHQPKGKQTTDTHGFWYTAVSGIWQTVWLEPVEMNNGYISSLKTKTDIDEEIVTVSAIIDFIQREYKIKVIAKDGDKIVESVEASTSEPIKLNISNAKLWSPENPFLYDLEIELYLNDKIVDRVKSYFGMRKISKIRDKNGLQRLALNNEVYFQFGLLDQGWWPDGLYRAPSDEALKYDIEVAKELGFNMLRKHGKMEPDRWYYWCDKLGILVWQDMTPGDIKGEFGTDRTQESSDQFELEYSEMISQLYNNPSVVTWVIFNEGWGQYDTKWLTNWTKALDDTRLVNSVSGFMDKGTGDIADVHTYPGPSGVPLEKNRAMVLGEFGGLGYPVKGHLWNPEKAWGYVDFKNTDELESAYQKLINKLPPYISEGLSGAIYTQITDVENETNGMMTYDREIKKMDETMLYKTAHSLRSIEPGIIKFVPMLPSSQETAQTWKYSFVEPNGNWMELDFNDDDWEIGEGGFGDRNSINPVVRTEWAVEEIWFRKEFYIKNLNDIDYYLNLFNMVGEKWAKDEIALRQKSYNKNIDDLEIYLKLFNQFEQSTKVYLNGESIKLNNEGFYSYKFEKISDNSKSLFKSGKNIIAVKCEQNMRQSYFDLGIYILHKDKEK